MAGAVRVLHVASLMRMSTGAGQPLRLAVSRRAVQRVPVRAGPLLLLLLLVCVLAFAVLTRAFCCGAVCS